MDNDFIDHYVEKYEDAYADISGRLLRDNSDLFNEEHLRKFIKVGHDLHDRGYVTSHGGNLSISDGEYIWITRKGARLSNLTADDVLMTGCKPYSDVEGVSSEINIHHSIYSGLVELAKREGKDFGTMSIIHALPPQTIFRSLVDKEIPSVSFESISVLGKSTPVIQADSKLDTNEMESVFEQVVAGGNLAVVIYGHGIFAAGKDVEDSLRTVDALEQSATLLNLFESTGRHFDPQSMHMSE